MSVQLEMCPICLDEFKNLKSICTPNNCAHKFCFNCLRIWAANHITCPVCRKTFSALNKIEKISLNEIGNYQDYSESDRTENENQDSPESDSTEDETEIEERADYPPHPYFLRPRLTQARNEVTSDHSDTYSSDSD